MSDLADDHQRFAEPRSSRGSVWLLPGNQETYHSDLDCQAIRESRRPPRQHYERALYEIVPGADHMVAWALLVDEAGAQSWFRVPADRPFRGSLFTFLAADRSIERMRPCLLCGRLGEAT